MTDHEEPRVSSRLRWEDVTLPNTVVVTDLDALIFSALKSDWQKTIFIVGSVGLNCTIKSMSLGYTVIAARIQCLAEAGLIESQGDLSMWRHSEVRLREA